jgi:hypothetical protein
MLWEFVKIAVSVAMLVLAPRLVQPLSWPALLVGLVLCMKVYWVALLWRGALKTRARRDRHDMAAVATVNAPTAGEYIIHHLHHLQVGSAASGPSTSTRSSGRCCWACWAAGSWRVAKSHAPRRAGRFQAAVEFLVEMVDTQAKGIVHNAKAASWSLRWR